MTYKENSNMFLSSSGTSCPATTMGYLRNSCDNWTNGENWVLTLLDEREPKNFSGIRGTTTLVHTVDGHFDYENMDPGSVVRNGDYIYMFGRVSETTQGMYDNYDYGTWFTLQVVEYQVSTGQKTTVDVKTLTEDECWIASSIALGWNTYLAFVEDRKIIIADRFDSEDAHEDFSQPGWYHVYLVDFATNTSTEILTIEADVGEVWWEWYHAWIYSYFLQQLLVIKDNIGDIHFIVGIQYGEDIDRRPSQPQRWKSGWCVYHKNYTQNTDWELYTLTGAENKQEGGAAEYIISNNRYYVQLGSLVYDRRDENTYFSAIFYVFDVLTLAYNRVQFELGSYPQGENYYSPSIENWFNIVEDTTNHKIYVPMIWMEEGGTDWYYFDSGPTKIFEFDPSTLTLNEVPIFDNGMAEYTMCSNTHAYNWEDNNNIYRTYDKLLRDNYTRPNLNSLSMFIDDNNNIWFMDGAIIKKYSLTTHQIERSIDTGITVGEIPLGIVPLGCHFMVTAKNDAGDVVDFYLVA